jgi:hypothetical protein
MCDLDYNVPKVIVRQTETSGLEKYAAAQPHHLLRQTMTPRFQWRMGATNPRQRRSDRTIKNLALCFIFKFTFFYEELIEFDTFSFLIAHY